MVISPRYQSARYNAVLVREQTLAVMSGSEDTLVAMPSPLVTERLVRGVAGLPVAAASVVLVLGGVGLLVLDGSARRLPGLLLILLGGAALRGLTAVAPGEARVLQLFGGYAGTMRATGLRWVNPLIVRTRISTRIRNQETPVAKVNDADGNPIEIAAVVVWQVQDTARALYEVDDLVAFVGTQTETAVRHLATSYPYDARGRQQLSLRDNANEVTAKLSAEIAARVVAAGVHVIESRLVRLAYAPEIAQTMLRRQQAEAIVAARQRIVDGAVGMVEQALSRLEDQDLVVLDNERRVAMVSNLLVVLCSDQAMLPVVNVGTLYS
jgi:regulator of protease activity HflC (stomatin/prohibitin superfamily)